MMKLGLVVSVLNRGSILVRPALGCRHFGASTVIYKKIVPRGLQKTSTSSQNWISRQINDQYVKRARMENYRARSAFKLIEIDDRFKILCPGYVVVECGAAPGAWTQVATARVNARNIDSSLPIGKVVAIDLSYVNPVEGAVIISHADFTSDDTQQQVWRHLNGRQADVVLSDMAGNATGVKTLDSDSIVQLATTALVFALRTLRPGGSFLCKIWDGSGSTQLVQNILAYFETVNHIKPESSRTHSSEMFHLARGFKGVVGADGKPLTKSEVS